MDSLDASEPAFTPTPTSQVLGEKVYQFQELTQVRHEASAGVHIDPTKASYIMSQLLANFLEMNRPLERGRKKSSMISNPNPNTLKPKPPKP